MPDSPYLLGWLAVCVGLALLGVVGGLALFS
jgi:hypothetical protein